MKSNKTLIILILVLTLILAGLIAAVIYINREPAPPDETSITTADSTGDTNSPSTEASTEATEPPIVRESSATVSAVGDVLMHIPVIKSGYQSDTGSYNFDTAFQYLLDYCTKADLAVANLETTLAGTDNGYAYSGYPKFNCPDGIVDSLKTAGFDVLLTANNHTYDTGTIGLQRTVQIVAERQLQYLGTKATADEPDYIITDLNGIQIGMLCYTYETSDGSDDILSLNGNTLSAADSPLVNAFSYQNLPAFYAELEDTLAQMETEGAEATILFIHWGNEYQTAANTTQQSIAQSLCDLGIDVIIGGHPHVVQPVELLTSSVEESHKTVCLYSLGNIISNQRKNLMNLNTGHTEDGVLFSVTFTKYSDGTVILEDVDLIPTWVNMYYDSNWKKHYDILPLDTDVENWQTQYGLKDSAFADAQASYDRTMAIVGEGMTAVDTWLAEHTAQVEHLLGVEN